MILFYYIADMAQLVEQRIRNAQVVGSSPTTSSIFLLFTSSFFVLYRLLFLLYQLHFLLFTYSLFTLYRLHFLLFIYSFFPLYTLHFLPFFIVFIKRLNEIIKR